jgi:urea transport system ATP-binding protein
VEKRILDIQNVTVAFDGFKVLDNLSFSMNYGELRFLIGPNGAGKTTLLDIITGKARALNGRVVFDEAHYIGNWQEHHRVRHGISRKFQTPSIFSSLSVLANLEAAIGFRTSYARLLRPMSGEHHDRVCATLEKIGLKDRAHVAAGLLSHGEKQWLEIGMLLTQEPKLLLLDEPVAGMTRRERDRTGELLQAIGKERSVLVVEHDMVFVRQFASQVTVLHMGQLLCEGAVETVQNDARVIEVYLGRSHQKTA